MIYLRSWRDDAVKSCLIIVESKANSTHAKRRHDACKRIFELFSYGYVAQACKIAGMKRPRGWSTG